MTTQLTGILIDPTTKTISKQTIDNTLEAVYELLDCKTVQDLRAGMHDMLVDEEGSFSKPAIFTFEGWGKIHGKAFIVYRGHASNWSNAQTSVTEITNLVKW